MSNPNPQPKQQCFANLAALHKQLEELATKTKRPAGERPQTQAVGGPVLIIRGK